MAEKNSKLTPFEKQQAEIAKKILGYKLGEEASIVSMIYKNPDLLRETNLELQEFSHNCWRVYFEIAKDLIINEKMVTLSEVDIGLYLDKHPKLADKYYNEYGGYKTIEDAGAYIKEENFDGYVEKLRKWNTVAKLIKYGFPLTVHFAKAEKEAKEKKELEEVKSKIVAFFTENKTNIDKISPVLSLCRDNGFSNPTEITDLDIAKKVLDACK